MRTATHNTRRHFLQQSAALAGMAAAAGSAWAKEPLSKLAPPASSSRRQPPFRLGMASYTLKDFPLEQALAMTVRVGLKQICLKSFHLPLEGTPEQIAEAAAKVGRAGLELYGGGVISMGTEAQVAQAFEYAKAAGMKTIVGVPAPKLLPLVNEKVQQYGICVAIHNHGPGDKVYPAPENAYEKIKGLDRRIGLCIDIGHTARIGADPVADARRFADRLLDVHVKDVSAASPKGQTVEIGRGVLDIPAFLRTLIEVRFSGVLAFEYEKDSKDPLPGLAESVGYVKGVLATL